MRMVEVVQDVIRSTLFNFESHWLHGDWLLDFKKGGADFFFWRIAFCQSLKRFHQTIGRCIQLSPILTAFLREFKIKLLDISFNSMILSESILLSFCDTSLALSFLPPPRLIFYFYFHCARICCKWHRGGRGIRDLGTCYYPLGPLNSMDERQLRSVN